MLQLRDPNAEFRITSLSRLNHEGGWQTAAQRSHVRPLLVWFTRGQGRFTIAGRTRGYGPHNAIFVPGGTMYGFDMLGQVQGTAAFFPVPLAADLPDHAMHLRIREGIQQAELTALVEALDREARQNRPGAGRALHHYGGLIAVWLDRHAHLCEHAMPPEAARQLAKDFAALIAHGERIGTEVTAYADRLGATVEEVTRACRAQTGKSASRLLSDRLHGEARRMLLDTDRPVTEIARRLGFASTAHFARAFQIETGKSPGAFRGGR